MPYLAQNATSFSSQSIHLKVTMQMSTQVNPAAPYISFPTSATIFILEKKLGGGFIEKF